MKFNSSAPYMERDFSWVFSADHGVEEGKLAGCSLPGNGQRSQLDDDLDFLLAKGITGIISLNEVPPDTKILASKGITHLILPVVDHYGPSQEQFDAMVNFVDSQKSCLIHCNAGQGRTGTLLAGYLVAKGMPAQEAITKLVKSRKGSCGTNSQRDSLVALETRLKQSDNPS